MAKPDQRNLPHIGWREWIVFPAFGNTTVKAKIDTGARTSAIHAYNIEIVRSDGEDRVTFDLHPIQDDDATVISCTARLIDVRPIKDSGGHEQERPVVQTQISLGSHTWPIELSLTNRDEMGFRMLLGRSALKNKFLVDPGRSYIFGDIARTRR